MSTSRNGTYSKIATITNNSTSSYKKTGLEVGKVYYFKVRAYVNNGNSKIYGGYSNIIETSTATKAPSNITTSTAISKKGVATVKWNQVSGASGYEVFMSTSQNGSYSKIAIVASNNILLYTKSNLTSGQTYYFKIRTYKEVEGKQRIYSGYTSVKSIKVN